MQLKQLNWERLECDRQDWVGSIHSSIFLVQFTLVYLREETYGIRSNVINLEGLQYKGLENTKEKAQDLFDAFVRNLYSY